MRTTIRMRSELARRAKAYAKKTDRTFTELVEDALTDLLDRGNGSSVKLKPLTVVGGKKTVTDEDVKSAVEKMNDEDDRRRLG